MKLPYLFIALFIFAGFCFAEGKKEILIIHSKSTHGDGCHRNKEVAYMLKDKIDKSKYAPQINVTISHKYPKDESLVEKADLIILSSDGGSQHALNGVDPETHMKQIDSILKKNKTGFIAIHWATDCPSTKKIGYTETCAANNALMHRWIGAYYYWGKPRSWTEKFPVKELKVNKAHPVANGLPEVFKLQDEYYWNFFTAGEDKRNIKEENVVFIHETMAGDYKGDKKLRLQSPYWVKTRDDGGRSAAMTSAHFYHTWANKHFFQTFVNSMFWTMNMKIPENGVEISAPTLDELKSHGKGATIYPKALYFELMKPVKAPK